MAFTCVLEVPLQIIKCSHKQYSSYLLDQVNCISCPLTSFYSLKIKANLNSFCATFLLYSKNFNFYKVIIFLFF